MKKLEPEFHLNWTRNKEVSIFSNEVKSRHFRKFLLPGPPRFDFFRLLIIRITTDQTANNALRVEHIRLPTVIITSSLV